jgi:acyl-CoA reductase-like NAD-dependent aldehyde dehydrogenase
MGDFLKTLGIEQQNRGGFNGEWIGSGPTLDVITPIDGSKIAAVKQVTEAEFDKVVQRAHAAFLTWRELPAPKRGEVVRQRRMPLTRSKRPEAGQLTAKSARPSFHISRRRAIAYGGTLARYRANKREKRLRGVARLADRLYSVNR